MFGIAGWGSGLRKRTGGCFIEGLPRTNGGKITSSVDRLKAGNVDNGSLRKLLICISVLALLVGGISPLVFTPGATAATNLDWTDAHGPGNGDAPAMVWDDNHDVLYRATKGRGVWKFQAGAWTSLGGELSTTDVTTLAYDKLGNKLYAGTNGAGIWEYDTTDSTWSDIAVIPGEFHSYFITSMAWGGGKLYVGCWRASDLQGMGVRCYDPAGSGTWTDTGGAITTWRIVFLAWGDSKVFVSCIDRSGGGETQKGIWYYEPADPGAGWTDTTSFASFTALAFDSVHKLLYGGRENVGLFCYDTASGVWTDLRIVYFGITCLDYDPVGSRLFAGRVDTNTGVYYGVWYHNDADPWLFETNWHDTDGAVRTYNITSLAYGADDLFNQNLFAGTPDRGVWRLNLSDSPSTWSDTHGGVSTCGISATAWDPTHNLLYTGTEGFGVWCFDASTGDWSDTGGGDSTSAVYSLAWGGGKLYAGCKNNSGTPIGVWRYDPSSHLWSDTGGGVSAFKANALAFDGSRNRLYAATEGHGVWCLDPATGDWTDTGGVMIARNVTSLVVGGGKLYAGCYDTVPGYEGVWSYDPANPGLGWTNTHGGVSAFRIYSLAWDGDGLYANCWASTGRDVQGVWYYDPSSPATDKWSAVTMPGIITLRIFSMALCGNRLYVSCTSWATDVDEGVWCYDPASDSWSDTGGDIGSLHISSLACDAATARLYAGTGNEGIWHADTRAAPTVTSVTPASGTTGTIVNITNLSGTGFFGTPTVKLKKSGQADIPASNVNVSSATKITCRFNLDNAAPGTWNVFVQNPDGKSATRDNAFTVTTVPAASLAWYLAEGTTAWGFSTYISIENPNAGAVKANVTYMLTGASPKTETLNLPASSQTTLANDHLLQVLGGQTDFSTKVECVDRTKSIAVDRTMFWTGQGAPSPEAHSSVGVTSPAKIWYLPEGSSAWGFESWLLIQNPNATSATVSVTYMIEGQGSASVSHKVPANSRVSFNMADDIGAKDASVKVVASVPVIPERAMYKNARREGHDSIGSTTPAADFYLAEGTTAWGFTTYVLVQNPNPGAASVTITYMTPSGPVPQSQFTMAANSRKTIRVNDVAGMGNTDFSTAVHGSRNIIAERAMYWGAGTSLGEACHDSIGMSTPAMNFYLPDGEAGGSIETWTLVQNPNGGPVTVDITYLTPSGQGNITKTETIPANSRMTYGMQAHSGLTGRASISVRSKTGGKPVMVERSMYWNNKGAGTDTIGASE